VVYDNEPFHVQQAATAACTVQRDIHLLSGSFDLSKGGGSLQVHVVNKTLPDYTITVGDKAGTSVQAHANLTCQGVPLATSGFIACNESAQTCNEVVLMAAGLQSLALDLKSGPNPPPPPPSHIILKDAMYHVSEAASAACTVHGDIHMISGTADDTGGLLTVHVVNGSIPDYTIHMQPVAQAQYGERKLNATLECGGAPLVCQGFASCNTTACDDFLLTFGPGSRSLAVDLDRGPNPPPPPPPPPTCGTSFSPSACKAVAGCEWCVSKDKLHALCFDKSSPPPAAGWSCQ